MVKLINVFLIIALFTPSFIAAEIYKWVNDDGSIGFTDDLSKVPEKYRDQVEIKKYRTNNAQKNDEGTRKSNQSITKEESVKEEYQKQEELSPEEKEELDKKLRGIWDDMKKSLKSR